MLASVQTPIPRRGYPSSRCCELNPSPELIGAASPGKAGAIPPSPQVITLSQKPALCKRAAPCSRWDNQWDCSRSSECGEYSEINLYMNGVLHTMLGEEEEAGHSHVTFNPPIISGPEVREWQKCPSSKRQGSLQLSFRLKHENFATR